MSTERWAALAICLAVAFSVWAFPRPGTEDDEWPNFGSKWRQL